MMGRRIHPSAIVDPAARLDKDVEIGPFCVVGPEVELGPGVVLMSHVVIDGRTRLGAGTKVYPFASLGLPPQDLKYRGEPSELVIGDGNTIREHVTMNPGTEGGGMVTRVGDGCLFMVGAHVAHDCQIGNGAILANNAALAGHVTIGDRAILGGYAAVHQFVRIGAHAMIGGMTGVDQDVIPYGLVVGERGRLEGLNLVGLKRRGVDREEIQALRDAFRLLFQEPGELTVRIAAVAAAHGDRALVREILSFLREDGGRKILRPRQADAS